MMKNAYGIMPILQHYGCMVDFGLLEEARKMVEEMLMKAYVVIWGCLMGAYVERVNGIIKQSKLAKIPGYSLATSAD
ncbi:hypothetical protein REPUB_Repub18cG0098200 [Reevesia pubescens]